MVGRIDAQDWMRLVKFPVSVAAALATGYGYLAWSRGFTSRLIAVCSATFLLACAASIINEVAERKRDRLMPRTRLRPIPAGKLSPLAALAMAGVLGLTGLMLLLAGGGVRATLVGSLALVCYDGIYTPLKLVTVLALLPGALVGAALPAIGWMGAGGPIDGRLLALSFFWFMWQVPHSCLLQLEVYNEYVAAGFPGWGGSLSPALVGRIVFVWITAAAASSLLIPLFGVSSSPWVGLSFALTGALLCLLAWRALERGRPLGAFRAINLYALGIATLGTVDALL